MSVVFDEVSFAYPGSTRRVVDGASFRAESGAIHVVTGPLNAGVSTVLLLACGLAPRVTHGRRWGTVTTLGCDPGDDRNRRALAGRVVTLLATPFTQLSGVAYSVWEEVAFGPANLGWTVETITESVESALRQVGMLHLARRDPTSLSGGELQRVLLAGCLAMRPELLILDEPFEELDAAGRDVVRRLLAAIAADTTVLLGMAEVDEVVDVADRVTVMHEARVVASGPGSEVLRAPPVLAVDATTTVARVYVDAGTTGRIPLSPEEAVGR